MKPLSDDEFTAFIGIDWADTKHDICLQAAHSERHEFSRIQHKVDAIDQWAMLMRQPAIRRSYRRCARVVQGTPGLCASEVRLLRALPINPSTLAKYREAFKPSRAKDDPTDAEHALDLLVHHRDRLAALRPQSAPMRTLLHLVEQRRRLVGDKTRFTNRLGYALKQYFPQALDWFEHIDTIVFCDFLMRWPTLIQIKRARATSVKAFFWSHNVRFVNVIDERIRAIKAATPLTHDAAVITAYRLQALVLVDQLRATLQAIDRFDAQIAEVAPTLPDYALFKALPGAGVHLAPRLLVAFGEQRERFAGAADLQKYSGVAPVTERSGNKCWIHWRWQCPTFLRQTFIEWAAQTIPRSYWAGAFYRQQRDKGSSHQAALRALAFKWLRILYRCWQTRTPYDESTYLNALKKRGSPLLNQLAPQT